MRACREGLARASEVLESMNLPFTAFWEGRSLRILDRTSPGLIQRMGHSPRAEHGAHGMRHEDLSGTLSGKALPKTKVREIIEQVSALVTRKTGKRPVGFRAPYCRPTNQVFDVLAELGYDYDASTTVEVTDTHPPAPYKLREHQGRRLWEMPLCCAQDACGKRISGYLWQMFEGERDPVDYVNLARFVAKTRPGALLQIAFHPWHLAVDSCGRPTRDGITHCCRQLRYVLENIGKISAVRYLGLKQSLQELRMRDQLL